MVIHDKFMQIAIDEAKRGLGFTSPNPAVGAVIVINNKVVAKGYHAKAGEFHAERMAIMQAGDLDLSQATLYSTLQPCAHQGRTPSCTSLIIERKIKTVVYGSTDPNPQVSNYSDLSLKEAGIEVISGVLQKECDALNPIYFFSMVHKRPLCILKAALTLDGKIATIENDSKWISNESSRDMVQKLRSRIAGIVVGGATWRHDKPRLNCRIDGFENKHILKIIFSNNLPNDEDYYLINNEASQKPSHVMSDLYAKGIDSLLIEGGSEVYRWFIKNNFVDLVYLFYKPAFMGEGISVVKSLGFTKVSELNEFAIQETKIIDSNILVILRRKELSCSLVL